MSFQVGDVFTARRIFTQADFNRFAALSGDDNPIHVDAAFAAQTRFGRPVAHGMLLYGVICGLLGRYFPAARQLEQNLTFTAPTYAGEPMAIRLEVTEMLPAARRVRVKTVISNPNGALVCDGETILQWDALPPEKE